MKPAVAACAILAAIVAGAAPGPAHRAAPIALRLIGVGTIAPDRGPDAAEVGGVSGIDYDPRTGRWYLISDDRSEHAPARFWAAAIDVAADRAPVVTQLVMIPLRTDDGRTFPAPGGGGEAADAESLRIDPHAGDLVWSWEGDARDGFGPAVRRMTIMGAPLGRVRLPAMFRFDPAGRTGPRAN